MEAMRMTTCIIEPAQGADFDKETSSLYKRLVNRAKDVVKAASSTVREATPKRDTAFQRMMLSVAAFLRSDQCTRVPGAPIIQDDGRRLLDDAGDSADADKFPTVPADNSECITIKSKQRLRTLYYLMHTEEGTGIPITKLEKLVGAGNQWDVVHRLRKQFGADMIRRTDFLLTNKTGKATWRANYWMTTEGKRVAAGILERSGYLHDVAAEVRHMYRPALAACEFWATSSADHDDLLLIRDGTRPQWLRLIYLLRATNHGWVSRYLAAELLDSRNIPEVVRIANEKLGGQTIESTMRTMMNRDGSLCEYGLYRLVEGSGDKVDRAVRAAATE